MTNSLLPHEILDLLQSLRPVFHSASWESFLYLITGMFLGYAKASVVRASLIAPPEYNWRRLHDFLRRNRWNANELMVGLTRLVLTALYSTGMPSHLFWVLDSTYLEKVYGKAIEGVLRHRRPHPKRGQGRRLYGHGLVVVAHLYQKSTHRFRALLLGGFLYIKQATFVELGQKMITTLPLPKNTHNIVVTDRGLTSLKLSKPLQKEGVYTLGRVKGNATFYLSATEADYKGKGRHPIYGQKFRADKVPSDLMQKAQMPIPVNGKLFMGNVSRGTFLRRGFAEPVELLRVDVGNLPPWLLMLTDPTLSTEEALWVYYGRSQVEVALGEGKDLGLDTYRGRRELGIQHWPMIIGVVHSLLQLIATGALKMTLPAQDWPWYRKETTVGTIQRRLIQWMLHRHFFDLFCHELNSKEMANAA